MVPISGITKNIIFSIWRLVRGEPLIFVCFYGWVVCPLKTGLYKVNGRSARVTPGHTRPPGRLPTRKNTQKSKFLLSHAFKWKKIMFFVIPEMPSKTFVMLYKKLPDHFKASCYVSWPGRRLSDPDSQDRFNKYKEVSWIPLSMILGAIKFNILVEILSGPQLFLLFN